MRNKLLGCIKKGTIILGWPIIFLIWVYQKTISPDHGVIKSFFPHGYCRFYPSCSEYGKQSIEKHGLFVGTSKAVWRIVRCNPWNNGGVDMP